MIKTEFDKNNLATAAKMGPLLPGGELMCLKEK